MPYYIRFYQSLLLICVFSFVQCSDAILGNQLLMPQLGCIPTVSFQHAGHAKPEKTHLRSMHNLNNKTTKEEYTCAAQEVRTSSDQRSIFVENQLDDSHILSDYPILPGGMQIFVKTLTGIIINHSFYTNIFGITLQDIKFIHLQ